MNPVASCLAGAIAFALAAAALLGCGQSEADQAEDAAVSYLDAIGETDYEEACDFAVERAYPACDRIVQRLGDRYSFNFPEATENDIEEDAGQVEVEADGDTYTLDMQRVDGAWKVSDLQP
ncbi:MAG: hypothetical protein ACRDNG_10535 [Gaiellaceae bacterium]